MAGLNNKQLSTIRKVLEQRNQQLRTEVQEEVITRDTQHFEDLAGSVADEGDASVAGMVTDLSTARMDRQIHEIRNIEEAMERIADGSYGLCAVCDKEIKYERLLAYPTATRCIECQSQYEKTFATENRPTL